MDRVLDAEIDGEIDGEEAFGPEDAPTGDDLPGGETPDGLEIEPVLVSCPAAPDDDDEDDSPFQFDDAPDDGLDYGHGIGFGPGDYVLSDDGTDDWQAPPEVIRTAIPAAAPLSGASIGMERGGREDDEMTGGRGGDDLRGRGGDDLMHGQGGADSLYGGAGADSLYGDNGRDRLAGGGGDDLLHGGLGRDRLYGGGGDDALYGDGGPDRMVGGRGSDSFNVFLDDGSVVFIRDFISGEDRLVCRGFDGPVGEDDVSFVPIRDGLSNTLVFGEVVATFDTSRGEVPTFDDLIFA